jgi:hypothetical protein
VLRRRQKGGVPIYTRRLPDGQIIMAMAAAGAVGGGKLSRLPVSGV